MCVCVGVCMCMCVWQFYVCGDVCVDVYVVMTVGVTPSLKLSLVFTEILMSNPNVIECPVNQCLSIEVV